MVKVRRVIKSQNRSSGTPSNFIVPLANPLQKVQKFSIPVVSIFNTFYNITTRNNRIKVVGVNEFNVLAPGLYTLTELLTQFKTNMDASTNLVWTITYLEPQMKVRITADASYSIDWTSENNIGKILGFDSILSESAGTDNTIFPSNALQLVNPEMITLRIKDVDDYGYQWGDSGLPISTIIPMTGNRGELIYYEPDNAFEFNFDPPRQIKNQMSVQLLYADGSEVEWASAEWFFIIEYENSI